MAKVLKGYDGGFWQLRDGTPLPTDRVPHPRVWAYFNDPALREDDPLRALLQDAGSDANTIEVLRQFCVWIDGPGCLYEETP